MTRSTNTVLTDEEINDGLRLHRLSADKPSQNSDCFRAGARWAVRAVIARLVAGDAVPVAWRYKDTRNHWRYHGPREPSYATEYNILKPSPLYDATALAQAKQHAIAEFLERTGQYLTNDASREAALQQARQQGYESARDEAAALAENTEINDAVGPYIEGEAAYELDQLARKIRALLPDRQPTQKESL